MSNLYNIELLKNVEKFIKKQSNDIQIIIIISIYKLPEGDVKKLKGYENY